MLCHIYIGLIINIASFTKELYYAMCYFLQKQTENNEYSNVIITMFLFNSSLIFQYFKAQHLNLLIVGQKITFYLLLLKCRP